MFFITMCMMTPPKKETLPQTTPAPRIPPQVDLGHVNTVFSEDL